MLMLNNHQYELVLLDTNALREISLDSYSTRKGFFDYFIDRGKKIIPCASWYSIVELKPYTDILTEFYNFFTTIPTLLAMPYKTTIWAEHDVSLNKRVMSVEKDLFTPLTSELLDRAFDAKNEIQSMLDSEISEFLGIAQLWENQRVSSSIKFDTVKCQECQSIINFIKACGIKADNAHLDIEAYPSARLMTYIHFMKIHSQRKELTPNDVVDIMISAIVPYVDIVITEKNQASLYQQAKHIKNISKLETLTLMDIRMAQ